MLLYIDACVPTIAPTRRIKLYISTNLEASCNTWKHYTLYKPCRVRIIPISRFPRTTQLSRDFPKNSSRLAVQYTQTPQKINTNSHWHPWPSTPSPLKTTHRIVSNSTIIITRRIGRKKPRTNERKERNSPVRDHERRRKTGSSRCAAWLWLSLYHVSGPSLDGAWTCRIDRSPARARGGLGACARPPMSTLVLGATLLLRGLLLFLGVLGCVCI